MHGCVQVGERCQLGEGPLVVFVPGDEPARVTLDGRAVEASHTTALGGQRLLVRPQKDGVLRVFVAGSDPALLCAGGDTRFLLRRLTQAALPTVPVLSVHEIPDGIRVNAVGQAG